MTEPARKEEIRQLSPEETAPLKIDLAAGGVQV